MLKLEDFYNHKYNTSELSSLMLVGFFTLITEDFYTQN
jgi:hypothetical protein